MENWWSSTAGSSTWEVSRKTFGYCSKTVSEVLYIVHINKYLISGYDGAAVLDTIEEYDADADSWTILETRLKIPRSVFGASVVPRSLVGC